MPDAFKKRIAEGSKIFLAVPVLILRVEVTKKKKAHIRRRKKKDVRLMRHLKFLSGTFFLLCALQGCADYDGSADGTRAANSGWIPVSSYAIPPGGSAPEIGYDAEVVQCLEDCQKTNRELTSVGLDNLRQCGCECLEGKTTWYHQFCRNIQGGILQGFNKDSIMDLKTKGNNT